MKTVRKYLYHAALNVLAQSSICPETLRKKLFNYFGHCIKGSVGPSSYIGYTTNKKLAIGEGSYTNVRCFFDMCDNIVIGRNCCISFNVTFATGTHQIGPSCKRGGGSPVIICDGCWIGADVTILPGVTIGKGCIIGAGSLVTKDCEPNSIYVGVPAKLLRKLET